jgi:hypothetical protein
MARGVVTIVSGLPRSGTSMMMKMLEVGGIPVLIDGIREADPDNPRGYYEFELVKQIETDDTWLERAQGSAVKMISALLRHLPSDYQYKVVFMRRRMEEILASQRKMLIRRGEPADRISDEQMAALFQKHLDQVEAWLNDQPNIDVLYVSFNDVVAEPLESIDAINDFLGGHLEVDAMVEVVDPMLYRQRR